MPPRLVCPTAHSPHSFLLGLGLLLSVGCSGSSTPDGDEPRGGSGGSPPGSAGASGSSGSSSGGAATAGSAGAVGSGGSSGSAAGGAGAGGSGGSAGSGSGGTAGAAAGGTGGAGGAGGAGGSGPMKSDGCDKARTLQDGSRTLQSNGSERRYTLRTPANYDSTRPYRLMLGFHGASGKSTDVAPSFFGLWDLAEGSTIFVAPDAVNGLWNADSDTRMVSDLIDELEAGLCIDRAHIAIEGFSQGGAMVWTLACALPGVFSAAVVHSGGGLPMPKACEPIPFFSALGNDGSDQTMSSDFFAMTNGCTIEPLPKPAAGGHLCSDYKGCSAGHPTRWCDYDGGHLATPVDSGQSKSWVPEEVWTFVKQF